MKKVAYVDDAFKHLEADIDKMRGKYRMYISFSGAQAAKAICLEILFNALDECRNPRSPADSIKIEYDERDDMIMISDNGRGIPTDKLELILTTLNSGSNIDSGSKVDLKANVLGRNGTGTLAMTALAEVLWVQTMRGGTENKFKEIQFEEGKKVSEREGACTPKQHGLTVRFRPSKILGKNTKIPWEQFREELVNLQFLNEKKIKMTSIYTNKDGIPEKEKYENQPLEMILPFRNGKAAIQTDKIKINVKQDDIIEEIGGKKYKRFIDMDVVFAFTDSMTPYIDSFCNGNNTIDNGSHLDGVDEGLCRFFQQATKATLSDRDKLDIKWDDVRTGLSVVVSLNTNMEEIFTSQTKHKILNDELEKLIKDETVEALQSYFKLKPNQLKEFVTFVKINARARREGDKARSAVVKETVTNWSAFKMKGFDPCTNKGKEYKELYIVEGDSAKGSLKNSRNPQYQALYAIRGVPANVFKLDLNGILANKEIEALIKIMGCNVGSKFDMNKLQYDKIIIASDADVDGLFIRSLLMSFFFKVYPEIIEAGRLFIAEPPLYKVRDKKNPFVINKEDYVKRYVDAVIKEYELGFHEVGRIGPGVYLEFIDKKDLRRVLTDTSSYVDDIHLLSQHYKINDRLVEIILEELAHRQYDNGITIPEMIKNVDLGDMMKRIGEEFPEMYYDEKDQLIKGVIDGRYQSIEISERLVRKLLPMMPIMEICGPDYGQNMVLRHRTTRTEHEHSLLGTLKILKKFQPDILHRFKGLGENSDDDIKFTIMDPNTRALIKVHFSDIQNDAKVFQTLRGTSPQDAASRKAMMKEYKIPRDLIDT